MLFQYKYSKIFSCNNTIFKEVIPIPCKYKFISDTLRSRIEDGTYPPETTLPTEQQLCTTFSASRQTVRQALKCLVDAGLIDRRQGSGSWVLPIDPSARSRRTVAIITTYISDYIFPGILREAEAVLSRNNCTTLLYATSNQVSNERRILMDILDNQNIDGILVEGTKAALPNPNLDLYLKLQARKIPLVFFNSKYSNLDAVSILDDNYNGGHMLVDYLVSKGHRKISGIFKNDDMQGHQRYAGFLDGLRDNNLPMEDSKIMWYCTEDKPRMTPGSSLWDEKIKPLLTDCTAVVCYNDEAASYLVQCLLQYNISIPDKIAVVSFDDSLYSNLSARKITSLSHTPLNAGRLSAEALLKLFDGKEVPSQNMPWSLMEKETS